MNEKELNDLLKEFESKISNFNEILAEREAKVRKQIYMQLLFVFKVSANDFKTIRLLKQVVLGHKNVIGKDGLE